MRKLYSGFSRSDASVQFQVWLEPQIEGRVISVTAFRADSEIASERHLLARDESRALSELVSALLAGIDARLAQPNRFH